MMKLEQTWQQLTQLPSEAQQEVVDFIAFLAQRYQPPQSRKVDRPVSLADEPFVGMWKDRKDLQDSTAWVRELRQKEW